MAHECLRRIRSFFEAELDRHTGLGAAFPEEVGRTYRVPPQKIFPVFLRAWLLAAAITAPVGTSWCRGRAPVPKQPPPPDRVRTMKVGGARGQPSYTLRISARGAQGVIDVQEATGSRVQTLTCSLGNGEPLPPGRRRGYRPWTRNS